MTTTFERIEHTGTQSPISDFQAQLGRMTARHVYALPDLTGELNHMGQLTEPGLDLPAGFYIDNNQMSEANKQNSDSPDAFTFLLQPGYRFGREQSHNKVFFGKLLMDWVASDDSQDTQIAIKPSQNRAMLLGELAMFQHMQALEIPTFTPNGFLATNNNTDYLLTKLSDPVLTMDTIDWRDQDMDEKWAQVSFAVDTLGLLHSNLLFHGDAAFRNIGFGEKGELSIVDPEYMVSAAELGEIALNSNNLELRNRAFILLKQRMSGDFTSLCRSIDEFIFGTLEPCEKPKNEGARMKEYVRHVLKPYREVIVERNSKFVVPILMAYADMLKDWKRRI